MNIDDQIGFMEETIEILNENLGAGLSTHLALKYKAILGSLKELKSLIINKDNGNVILTVSMDRFKVIHDINNLDDLLEKAMQHDKKV